MSQICLGLGQMGYGMATNIRKKMSKNSTMFINDVNSEACQDFANELKSHGPIEIVATAKEAATRAPVLVSIVPAAQHVRQVYLDKERPCVSPLQRPLQRLLSFCLLTDLAIDSPKSTLPHR